MNPDGTACAVAPVRRGRLCRARCRARLLRPMARSASLARTPHARERRRPRGGIDGGEPPRRPSPWPRTPAGQRSARHAGRGRTPRPPAAARGAPCAFGSASHREKTLVRRIRTIKICCALRAGHPHRRVAVLRVAHKITPYTPLTSGTAGTAREAAGTRGAKRHAHGASANRDLSLLHSLAEHNFARLPSAPWASHLL